jgi:hypothetical protein
VSNDKIIPFPKNRIVNQRSRELDEQRRKMGNKVAKEIEKQQTKQFVETSVDDMSMNLLKQFYDMAIKTDKHSFTKDLALLVDVMRGLMYRDFDIKHPAQKLSDKMVTLCLTLLRRLLYVIPLASSGSNVIPVSFKSFKSSLTSLLNGLPFLILVSVTPV